MSDNPSYVYDGHEVRKTGRQATKEIPRTKGEPMRFHLYEVTPIDDTGWLKWVEEKELFQIDN